MPRQPGGPYPGRPEGGSRPHHPSHQPVQGVLPLKQPLVYSTYSFSSHLHFEDLKGHPISVNAFDVTRNSSNCDRWAYKILSLSGCFLDLMTISSPSSRAPRGFLPPRTGSLPFGEGLLRWIHPTSSFAPPRRVPEQRFSPRPRRLPLPWPVDVWNKALSRTRKRRRNPTAAG